jgi:phosphoglycerate dehydrogenase-like enzyme
MTQILCDVRLRPESVRSLEGRPGLKIIAVDPAEHARDLPAAQLRETDILFCTIPPSNHRELARLKLIQLTSVGYSQIYGLDLVARGVRACNARGVFETTIAEWNVAMMVNLARDLRGMIRNQEHGIWDKAQRFQNEIRGRTVGLWGYGGIGRDTARLAKALGMTVHVMVKSKLGPRGDFYSVPGTGDPMGQLPDRVFTRGQELEFLAGLDFLVLAMPLTPANTGLIGVRELKALKPTACILNPARGPLINEAALLQALREGWIAGAALDTHYYYPMPADHPLWRFPNVIMTPHISGSDLSPYFLDRIWEIFTHNVDSFLAGKPLWNELTTTEMNGA